MAHRQRNYRRRANEMAQQENEYPVMPEVGDGEDSDGEEGEYHESGELLEDYAKRLFSIQCKSTMSKGAMCKVHEFIYEKAEVIARLKREGYLPRLPKFIQDEALSDTPKIFYNVVYQRKWGDNWVTREECELERIPKKYYDHADYQIICIKGFVKLKGILKTLSSHHPNLFERGKPLCNLSADGVPLANSGSTRLMVCNL